MALKQKSVALEKEEEIDDPSEKLLFKNLGAGVEVGRSCHILQYKGKTVMLDAGMHPAKEGSTALPFFDEFDLSTVDILLITHFHLDHAAALPYVLSKTNFKGRVFMTHATKAIYQWLIKDNVRVNNTSSSSDQRTTLYNEQDHISTLSMIETIDFNTTHTINSISITPLPAGHVLGAAMYLISIAGANILFTGDYSREQDRHLISAEVPRGVRVDILICESTFGISSNPPRADREHALTKAISNVINRGGRVLLPVFALGRAQELLLILDEYWSRRPDLQKTPIYYIGNIARQCMVVYQTYIGAMNDNIKRLFRERMAEAEARGDRSTTAGPWDFRFVRSVRSIDRFHDPGSCVMLASPGMLQNGTSRILLEKWAPSEKNGVILTGYSVEGTMGKQIVNEPDEIPAVATAKTAITSTRPRFGGGEEEQKIMIPRRCTVDEISFAAHVDGNENIEFIEEVGAPVVILVHGEQHQMMRLKSKLRSLNDGKATEVKVLTPRNCFEVEIPIQVDRVAKVVGKLAETAPPRKAGEEHAQPMNGVLVQNGFKYSLMAPEDLQEYTGLTTTTITCKQRITLGTCGIELIRWALEGTFGAVEDITLQRNEDVKEEEDSTDGSVKREESMEDDTDKEEEADEEVPRNLDLPTYLIMGCIIIRYIPRTREVELEWEGNLMNDGKADAVMAVLMTVESSPASVKRTSKNHSHSHHHHHNGAVSPYDLPHPHADLDPNERFARLCMILEAQFGSDIAPIETPKIDHLIKRNSQPPPAASQTPNGGTTATTTPGESTTPADKTETQEEVNKEEGANGRDEDDFTEEEIAEIAEMELDRLRSLGIPFPGIEIRVDQHVARVWLETMEVECSFMVLRQRVKAVVERAMETVSGLWKTWGWKEKDSETDAEAKLNGGDSLAKTEENGPGKPGEQHGHPSDQTPNDSAVKEEDDDEKIHVKQEVET